MSEETEQLEQLEKWTHLGDGCYAKFDGYQIWLGTLGMGGVVGHVALDPHVEKAFARWVAQKNSVLGNIRLARKDAAEKRGE